MPRRTTPTTAPRKTPVQARSTQLVADILQAAIRVLEREGAQRFTTIRVAEEAGVSVGSLYQYFPNKQSILVRLQTDEWGTTGATLDAILGDRARPPLVRLRAAIRAFFQSERDEAPLRIALADAAPVWRDAPEAQASRARSAAGLRAFVATAAPAANPSQRAFAGELIGATMSALGKQLSERSALTRGDIDRWADAVADMLGAYLAQLSARRSPLRVRRRAPAMARRTPGPTRPR